MVEARSMCRTTQHCFGFLAVLFSKAYLTGWHLTWWDDLHDTSMTPWRVVCRLLFMARPTSPSWEFPSVNLHSCSPRPRLHLHGCLPSSSKHKTSIHGELSVPSCVLRSYYTLRLNEPIRSVAGFFYFFPHNHKFPLFFYKFSHGIKFSTVKKVTPGTSIEHLNDQNMFIWNWRKGAGRSSCSRSPTPICRMIKGFHSKSVPSSYPEKSIIFPLYFPSDWLTH